MPLTKNCPCCGQAVPTELQARTAERVAELRAESMRYLRQRALETAPAEPRTPVITDRSPGVVYANALRRARKLGYNV